MNPDELSANTEKYFSFIYRDDKNKIKKRMKIFKKAYAFLKWN